MAPDRAETAAVPAVGEPQAKKAKVAEIAKPDTHRRTYSFLELENGVRVIVASDPTCDKAGAAACMNVGMCHERKDLPGLAHFLEHMLFTGTKKYPDENEYHEFISQNGGKANACTACYFTTFMFEVKPEKLEDVLDRFGRFFSEPILSRECTEREVNAVDSEFKMGYTDPWWRFVGIMDMSANPEHPFHAAVGNNKVLLDDPKAKGIDLYTEMRRLYDDTYSANGLTVCIIGKESVRELEAMAKDKFGAVVNKGKTMPRGDDHGEGKPPFLPKDWHQLLLQNPVKDVKEFQLTWVIPYQAPLWRTKPAFFLSHLLAYEGEGSVISALKDLGLISSCNSFDGEWLQGSFTLFSLQCDLTDKGLTELKTIGKYFFAYIKMLREKEVQKEKWLWDELSNIQNMQFKLGEDMQPYDLAEQIVGSLQTLPPSEVLAGEELLYEYDPDGIKRILDLLQLDTVRVSHQAKCLAERCTDKDTSYDSPMKFEAIPEDWLKEWSGDLDAEALGLSLPKKNLFIPEDLSVKSLSGKAAILPKRVRSDLVPSPIACIIHRQDDLFLQPKSNVCISIWSPYIMQSASSLLMARMWCMCVQEELNEYAYDAEIAGLGYCIGANAGHISLNLSGFNDKLGVLLKTVVEKMRSFSEIPENIYEIVSDSVQDELNNAVFHSQPCSQVDFRFIDLANRGNTYPLEAQFEAFQEFEREDFNDLPSKLFAACHVELLVLGNATPLDTKELGEILTTGLQLSKTLEVLPDRKEAALLPGTTVWKVASKDEDDPNSAIKMWMQFTLTDENKAVMFLLNSIIGTKFFDVLRTQQQLGYIVGMGPSVTTSFCYLTALVQTEFPIDYTRSRIELCFTDLFKWVREELTEEEFSTCCGGVLAELKSKPKNLSEEMQHWSKGFNDRTYDFGSRQRVIDLIEKKVLTLEKLKAFVVEKIPLAPKLYIEVVKAEAAHVFEEGTKITAEMVDPESIARVCLGPSGKKEDDEAEDEAEDVTVAVVHALRKSRCYEFARSEASEEKQKLTILTEVKCSKPLPAGATTPPDAPEIRKWLGEEEGVKAFEAGTPGWVPWNGSKPDAWKVAEL